MPPKLAARPQVLALAQDLGLKPSGNPLQDILSYVRRHVGSYLKEVPCERLNELLRLVASRVDTLFIEVHSDQDLRDLRDRYIRDGELAFADVENELANPHTYGITYRLKTPRISQRRFVSVIDCRGEKAFRSYFTKWHELAHLLTLTPQQRFKFYRTHVRPEEKDPEEAVMDMIAGNIGFFDEIVRRHAAGPISFSAIADLKERLCPEASVQASVFGFVQAWPQASLFLEAKWGRKKRDADRIAHGLLKPGNAPDPALRVAGTTPNAPAREIDLFIPLNMRIPEQSVIVQILDGDRTE